MNKLTSLLLAFALTFVIAFIISIYGKSDVKKDTVFVTRAMDGDTIELSDSRRVRLLNINAPEKGANNYEMSLNYMKWLENKTVSIETSGTDKYGRTLAKVYAPDYINLEIVEKGLANKYLVDEKELKLFDSAEKKAIENSYGIWKKSEFYNCLEADIKPKEELIFIRNNCKMSTKGFIIKEEGRKTYTLQRDIKTVILHTISGTDNETDLFWGSKSNIWNDDRDTLYIFDSGGDIVLYESYGY